jgi:multisubunit Na+/H+ antiporter MnhG subunit
VTSLLVDALLAAAVVTAWLGTAALIVLRTAYDRLHAASYVVVATGFFVTAAVVAAGPLSTAALKAAMVYVALIATGAVLNHAIGRAMRVREASSDRP